MKAPTTGTVRFTAVVEACGQPEVAYLWTPPQQDKAFMSAVREQRVMTIKQETAGTKKDFGVVGFEKGKSVSYFIFPKPLAAFRNRRIIGIKYDLVRTPGPVGRVVPAAAQEPTGLGRRFRPTGLTTQSSVQGELRPKPGKQFRVTIRFTATADVSEQVQASSKKAAQEKAVRLASRPDLARGTVTRKVVKVTEV